MVSRETRYLVTTSRATRGTRARAGATGLAAVMALVGTGALATSAGAATAASPRASSGSTVGTVASLDAKAGSFTVRTSTGATVEVKVSKATSYHEVGVKSPGFADVKVGESVAVIGTTKSGVETAIVVVVGHASAGGAPGAGGPGGFFGGGAFGGGTFGKVTKVDSSARSFTVKETSGSTVKVEVGKDTTYRDRSVSSVSSASFADVKVGESVAVIGTTKSGVETARSVVIGAFGTGHGPGGPGGFFGGGTFGKVTNVDSSAHSFTVKETSGSTVKVEVGKDTTYRDRSVSSASFADVKVGESVAVIGTTKSGVETARSVVIGIGGPRPTAS